MSIFEHREGAYSNIVEEHSPKIVKEYFANIVEEHSSDIAKNHLPNIVKEQFRDASATIRHQVAEKISRERLTPWFMQMPREFRLRLRRIIMRVCMVQLLRTLVRELMRQCLI